MDEGAFAQLPQHAAQSLTSRPAHSSEREYLLEYYALVRAGKTNYVATTAMLAFFGHRGQEPTEFFKTYSVRLCFLFHPFCERNTDFGIGLCPGRVQAEEAAHDKERGRGECTDAGVWTWEGRGCGCEERG